MKLDLHAAILVGIDFFSGRAGDDCGVDAIHFGINAVIARLRQPRDDAADAGEIIVVAGVFGRPDLKQLLLIVCLA